MEAGNRLCIICSATNSSYKCPKCSKFYCSVGCCRQHKLSAGCAAIEKTTTPLSSDKEHGDSKFMDYPTEDTVPIEQLRLLGTNQELKSLLRGNFQLHNLLRTIDRSSDPSTSLKSAMQQSQDFQRFASICIRTVTGEDNVDSGRRDSEELAHLMTLISKDSDAPVSVDEVSKFISMLSDQVSDDTDNSESIFHVKSC